ncbi:class F sortase [Micromonospora sp. WMMD714]|uniref:class F sortase n=1 Tax=Micromonospora sp. WMMD714 TaxID=3016097 RepID=UPI00249BAF34|nr:class F sortase [Micromonospora sp. WMMD714]WFE65932.1 class F sortase [Micromonospora sp. WMMD714]
MGVRERAARTRTAIAAVAVSGTTGIALLAAGLTVGPVGPPQPSIDVSGGNGSRSPIPALPRSTPVRLDIPAIGVHADLVPVAGDPNGVLEVPPLDRPAVAGWYRPGVSPGEAGNAVLVGHVDTREGPAVFFALGRLRPGDAVRVTRADGRTVTFAVDGVGAYPKPSFPTGLVYGPGGPGPALRLVTCGGRFDERSRDYSDNIVVRATAVG